MKSRITIEVDFENQNAPIIQILQCPDSDDVRDGLIKHFLQSLHGSSWLHIEHKDGNHDFNRVHISPISPLQLKEQAEKMLEQHNHYVEYIERNANAQTGTATPA